MLFLTAAALLFAGSVVLGFRAYSFCAASYDNQLCGFVIVVKSLGFLAWVLFGHRHRWSCFLID